MSNAPTLTMDSPPGPEITIDGKPYLYFGGTSYFGLHSHSELIRAGVDAWQRYGTNSATLRTGLGTAPPHADVERAVVEFFECENAAYVASGYLSNLAGLQALRANGSFDAVFVDEKSHYCVLDAANATGSPVHTYKHLDPNDLCNAIERALGASERPLILSDGLFPAIGEIAPLPAYLEIATEFDGHIWLDDAHGAGVLGPNGRGTADHFDIDSERVHNCGTLAKAFGGFGGFICGSNAFIETVRTSPVMRGASAPPTPVAAATAAGIRLTARNRHWREALRSNARYLKEQLQQLGVHIEVNDIPIVAFSLRDAKSMREVRDHLFECGIAIQFVEYPGTAAGGMLRIVVFSNHSACHIDRLCDSLRQIL